MSLSAGSFHLAQTSTAGATFTLSHAFHDKLQEKIWLLRLISLISKRMLHASMRANSRSNMHAI
jgi:hypothetical protein